MPITRAQLETRRAELQVQLEQLKQQFTITTGALADIEFWLSEVDHAVPIEEPEAV